MKKQILFICVLLIVGLTACTNTTENNEVVFVPDESVSSQFVIDESFGISSEDGQILTAVIPSNDGTKLVYSEWSENMLDRNVRSSEWNYQIILMDLQTGELEVLFVENNENAFNLIPRAFAGGCANAYLPIAWTPSDSKIVIETVIPNQCGAGGAYPESGYYLLELDSGELVFLGDYASLLSSDYSLAVHTENNELTPGYCGPGAENNNGGRIVLTELENGQSEVILEEVNAIYRLLEINSEENKLLYEEYNVEADEYGCAEKSSEVSQKTIFYLAVPKRE